MTRNSAPHLERGRRAEQLAARFLQRHGLRLVATNYRCRLGEIDLVLESGPLLVVCEVRYRSSPDRQRLAASIDRRKQRRIAATTLHFLRAHDGLAERPVRFDVVLVSGPLTRPNIDWVTGAFDAEA